ncbi:aminopeptidase N [Synechococcus sp. RSCCF101]|uniref:aminopeptidase N n=1 Tax=Synechococcus sp. RSCCF101 TaxID=2511069 RepID=UPI0012461DD5|nr:aminopeptidase N [Synechococcus sp. RSCCF101]QEY31043.1 aminopeptidase N [Synechococcus sp. RSCCF101]
MGPARTIHLSDYRPWPFTIPTTRLDVVVHADHTLVTAELELEPAPGADPQTGHLVLLGRDLQLESVCIDGEPLAAEAFHCTAEELRIAEPPQRPFRLLTRCRIHPAENTSLEGLYASGGMLTTQCEAEGFRRITFHPDRPDVLSRYRVSIEADADTYPVLLSNGDCTASERLPGGRHRVIWEDPFPKPSYLFAMVAGRLVEVSDSFTTASGRPVRLRLHVEPGDEPYTAHAMASLKRAMRWDEEVYGLEYDLNEYNIVAVRHFNMGAMENKSLNIFNSKLVLADAETATDAELERIESVVAHEYFHNWTGNRITCRDWFQLSLKEGLTVFRDQSFTADLHSAAVKRIEDAALMRSVQFREDAGPTAHPVKPAEYQAIDNFYTTTIYEKGAELIRMLHGVLGPEAFMAGMQRYVERHDGQAATTEQFVAAIADGAGGDGESPAPVLDQPAFRRWYELAGTPRVAIERHWRPGTGELVLQLSQHTPATPGQPEPKPPLPIPLRLALIGPDGTRLPFRMGEEARSRAEERLLLLDLPRAEVVLSVDSAAASATAETTADATNGAAAPALSLLRGFSAPVLVEMERPTSELLHLFAHDDDAFARWDAGQILQRQALIARAGGQPDVALEQGLLEAFGRILGDGRLQPAERCCLLLTPGLADLEAVLPEPDPLALHAAREAFLSHVGDALQEPVAGVLTLCEAGWAEPWPAGAGERDLTALLWRWRTAAGDAGVMEAAAAAVHGRSMSLARAGLQALQAHRGAWRERALQAFHDRWRDRPVILDSWFALEASAPFADGIARVERLMAHPAFDPLAPNTIRSVFGGFSRNVPAFHATDGSGYRFLAERLLEVDARNAITASRMAKLFSRWGSYGPERRARMRDALEQLSGAELSPNTREVVAQCLGAGGD